MSQEPETTDRFQVEVDRIQKEIDQADAQLELEQVMERASSELEIDEILREARTHGEVYGKGFEDGFYKGFNFCADKVSARNQSIGEKYDRLT